MKKSSWSQRYHDFDMKKVIITIIIIIINSSPCSRLYNSYDVSLRFGGFGIRSTNNPLIIIFLYSQLLTA